MLHSKSQNKVLSILLIVALTLVMMLAALPVGAQGGNLDCPAGEETFKIDNPEDGVTIKYTVPGYDGLLEITTTISADGRTLDWSANFVVGSVIVKGGSETANVFPGGTSGNGLQSPLNSGGEIPQISNIKFCFKPAPAITLDKTVNVGEVCIGKDETVTYSYKLTNTGNVPVLVSIVDDNGTPGDTSDDFSVTTDYLLALGETKTFDVNRTLNLTDALTNTATASAHIGVLTASATDTATVQAKDCSTPEPVAQGCTRGYWGRDQHFDSWVGYSPSDSFSAVFGRNIAGNPTLVQAINMGGGGLKQLAAQSVAALLNAAHPTVNYKYSVSEVISMFQAAYDSGNYEATKNLFDKANNAGCPLN